MAPARSPLAGKRIVVLPDFYVDAVARMPPWPQAMAGLQAIAARGGGNLPIGPVEFKAGGQAANVGVALARLGARVQLVTRTDAHGRRMLADVAGLTGLGLRHVAVGPATSATLALETGEANVMLSHAGPLAAFGPAQVTAAAWRDVERADAVVVTNWSQDRKGTALLAALARRLQGRKAFLYVDTGDLRHRPAADVRGLLGARAMWARVDAWGLNENEVGAAAAGAGLAGSGRTGRAVGDAADRADEAVVLQAAELSRRLGSRLDVHTRRWAASFGPDDDAESPVVRVPAPAGRARRLTGAGDAWNAGNLAGHLLRLDAAARLRLAHAVATRYVTAAAGLPPSWRDVPARLWPAGPAARAAPRRRGARHAAGTRRTAAAR